MPQITSGQGSSSNGTFRSGSANVGSDAAPAFGLGQPFDVVEDCSVLAMPKTIGGTIGGIGWLAVVFGWSWSEIDSSVTDVISLSGSGCNSIYTEYQCHFSQY